ncbi:PepSY domain-containing protein [Pedobacter sp. L105]|uniref:PepSY-associated TM helix domain-containing protein n=1 Tax=Pedobacter sp. L105 TaxID=1641871 RepID=UPI00131BE2E4|nr:PepSY-associated TM helix domain-containing protein [Pedobacter sp. L105]
MTKKFKDTIRQIHLWLGLGTGLVVFIVSVTGCLYVFEKEIREYIQKDYAYVPLENKAFVGLDSISKSFVKIAPKEKITSVKVTNVPNATVSITTPKKHVYYFDPYTGKLVKKTSTDWLVTVKNIHTSLLLGEPGEFIMHWSVVIFVLMLISGWILWFPNQMRLLKQSLTIKWNASAKRINYDLHNVLGFYASGFLIVISLSGLYMAFDSVKSAANFLTGTELSDVKVKGHKDKGAKIKGIKKEGHKIKAEAKGDSVIRYDEIYSDLAAKYPGAISTQLTTRKTGDLRVRMTYPSNWVRNISTFIYKPGTGKLSKYKLYQNFTAADIMESTDLDLHTGQLFGLFGKIMACTASLISASLPVTGFIIWLKKKKKGKKREKKKLVFFTRRTTAHAATEVTV